MIVPAATRQVASEVEPRADAIKPVEHDAEEAGFEEKRRENFKSDQRTDHRASFLGEPRKVRPELERQHNSGDDPYAERHGKNAQPELIDCEVERVARTEPLAFHDGKKEREPN